MYTIFWYAIFGLFFIFATISVYMQTFFYNTYTIDLINDEASICTAELLAIEAAIEYIWDSSYEEFMIITDSLSSLQALKS